MSKSTQAIVGGAFMALAGWAANAVFEAEFTFVLVPIWFIGVVVLGVGVWMRVSDT
ncbi:MAG: hypothetical protein ACYTDU_08035 [Planctomycetota bacterium]|jgi:hypothetical protein